RRRAIRHRTRRFRQGRAGVARRPRRTTAGQYEWPCGRLKPGTFEPAAGFLDVLSAVTSVRSLLLAIFMLMAGGGFMATLIAVRLERSGSSALIVGAVGTAYFLGLVIGSTKAGRLVARVGHIRAFAAFVSLFSASTLSYAL